MFCVERSRRIGRTFLGALPGAPDRLIAAVGVTGVVGGLIGAAYVAASHPAPSRALADATGRVGAHWLLLIAVGAVIAVLLRLLGDAGDTELLVDNIHVSGGADRLGPSGRSSPCPCSASRSAAASAPRRRSADDGHHRVVHRTRFGLNAEQRRICTITGMAAGFTVLFAARSERRCSRWRSCTAAASATPRRSSPPSSARCAGYAVYVAVTGLGLQPIWTFPRRPPPAGPRPRLGRGRGVGGALVATVFTYSSRSFRGGLPPHPGRGPRPVLGGLALGGLAFVVAVRR